MTIKEIRTVSGLTQKEFAQKYDIPVQTLKGWESAPESTSHRDCPPYVLKLLERVVIVDYRKNQNG